MNIVNARTVWNAESNPQVNNEFSRPPVRNYTFVKWGALALTYLALVGWRHQHYDNFYGPSRQYGDGEYLYFAELYLVLPPSGS